MNRNIAPHLNELVAPTLLPHQREELSNGVEVIYLNDPRQEIFKMDVIFPAGTYYQPQPIVASTMLNLLNEGTRYHTSAEIAELFDFHGAYVEYNCGLHQSELSLIALQKYASQTIRQVAEMVQASTFPEKELAIYLRNRKQEHLINLEKTTYLASQEFRRAFFGEQHPYANYFTVSDFDTIQRDVIEQFYRERIHATGCRILVSGKVDGQVLQEIHRHFSTLPPTALPPEPHFTPSPSSPQRYHVPKTDAVQASIRMGMSGVHLLDEDYAHFQLLNMVLGGYFGSRLMSNIREEKGYTYSIHSFNVSLKQAAYWNVATDVNTDQVEATLTEIHKEISRLREELIPDEELNLVKNYFHGELLRELDGVFSQADALKHKLHYGIDNTFYLKIMKRIKTCTPEKLLQAAQKYFLPEKMYTIVVG